MDFGLLPDDRSIIVRALTREAGGSEAHHLLGALCDIGGQGAWIAVALKPGKPLVFGRLGTARCLFLPGNPVAALVRALLFARSLVDRLRGAPDRLVRGLPTLAAAGWPRRPGHEEFAPAIVRDRSPFCAERIGRPALPGPCRWSPRTG